MQISNEQFKTLPRRKIEKRERYDEMRDFWYHWFYVVILAIFNTVFFPCLFQGVKPPVCK